MNDKTANLGRAIKAVLPNGSNPSFSTEQAEFDPSDGCPPKWRAAPAFPPDLFATVGYLCKVGSVVPYFDPSPYAEPSGDCHFGLTRTDRDQANEAADQWREKWQSGLPKLVRELWQVLVYNWDTALTPGQYHEESAPWWKAALTLAIISDMACNRVLKDKHPKHDHSPFEQWIHTEYLLAELDAIKNEKEFRPPASLTLMVDTTVVCVLPKMRVAPVGATFRNVSRNLALLPGRGEVRCYWSNISIGSMPSEDDEALDILLIPEPRFLDALNFHPVTNGGRPPEKVHWDKWNWENFNLLQKWIDTAKQRARFIEDAERLLRAAKRQTTGVNAVVLPEYAVDYALFDALCARLKRIEPRLEFVISGSSDNCDEHEGNHVLTRVWDDQQKPGIHETKSRRKHHRWRMDRTQIETYGLSSALNPKIPNWWEATPLGRREIYFHRFRKASAFSVLICEELARSDPCHEILRSVAPNLIFALLLDGPQIKNRWPAQYASNLADDPGSSVLTFTSYGLIDRSNKQGKFSENHCIAMWKDDSGTFVEIEMPKGDGPRGVLLSLWPEHVIDITIAGKRSEERAWRYSGHFPIVLE